MAPRVLQSESFSGEEAVTWIEEARREALSWIPAKETEEAPACQRIDSWGWKEERRWRACRAVIQTWG